METKELRIDELVYPELEQPFILKVDFAGVLNYSLQQSGLPLLMIEARNNLPETMSDLTLKIEFEFDFAVDYEEKIESLSGGETFETVPKLKIHARKLFELSEMMTDSMKLSVIGADEGIIATQTLDLPVLPTDQWSGTKYFPESIAAFVMPNIPDVKLLMASAGNLLKRRDPAASFDGYQSGDKNKVRAQAAAIYGAIYEQKINYQDIPPTFFQLGQRVRTPQEVLRYKQGNCIEMAALFCSVAEAAGLRPFIVLVKGHAFAGVWLTEDIFSTNRVPDVTEITKRLAQGINDVEILECTLMNTGAGGNFEEAVRHARTRLEREYEFTAAIDIYRSHLSGIRPLPITVEKNGETVIIDYGLADDADKQAVSELTIEEHFLVTEQEDKMTKQQIWMRNLLDLSKRNPLISFRPGQKTVQLFTSNLGVLEDALADGEDFELREMPPTWRNKDAKVQFLDVDSEAQEATRITESEFKSKRLRTFLTRSELDRRLKNQFRDARSSLEETGSNTLYLALGFLRWFDPKEGNSATERLAPLILLPVDLKRRSRGAYRLVLRDEDAQLNLSIIEKLRQDFDITISGLDPLPLDQSGVDLPLVFNSIRKAIMNMPGWDVLELAFLSLFSFSQFVMWSDLRNRFDVLLDSKVVRALNTGSYTDYNDQEITPDKIDELLEVSDLTIPSSVDSSQLAAIIEAGQGGSFVLHGPPGTGKSQTITNLIANTLNMGKTVLFVAEKMVALNVVKDRLEAMGLGDYALELHSNKTNKRTVLDKLDKNIRAGRRSSSKQFEYQARRIQRIKDKLNMEIADLHRSRTCGRTLYQLINDSMEYKGVDPLFTFTPELLDTVTIESWDEWNLLVRRLGRTAEYIESSPGRHPLRAFTASNYSLQNQRELTSELTHYTTQLRSLHEGYEAVSKAARQDDQLMDSGLFSLLHDKTRFDILLQLAVTLEDLNLKVDLDALAMKRLLDSETHAAFASALEVHERMQAGRQQLLDHYHPDILSYNVTETKKAYLEAGQSFFLLRKSKLRKALLDLNALARNGHAVQANQAPKEFDRLAQYQEDVLNWETASDRIIRLLGVDLPPGTDISNQINALTALQQTLAALRDEYGLADDVLYEHYAYTGNLRTHYLGGITTFFTDLGKLETSITKVQDLAGIARADLLDASLTLDEQEARIQSWITHMDRWKSWASFCAAAEDLRKEGLHTVIERFTDSENPFDTDLYETFNASLIHQLIRHYIEASEHLSRFHGREFESQIQHYNELNDEFEKLSQEQIRINLAKNLPNPRTSSETEQGQAAALSRIIHSKGRGTSIRQIFESSNQMIKRLTPVLLMSPLSVAQYLDPTFPKFDLLIFDEASQIRTSVAVGAMSRAENCIIVGDPNQMPPTSFFSTNKVDEDNLEIEDLESVLDDGLAANMPQYHLDWHYRSQSESLINFSNVMYYKGRMMTFPSPADQSSRVTFDNVRGIYDRGGSNTNRIEAQAIVAEITRRLRDPELRKDSMGVVTFNIKQQNLVDDLLQEEFAQDRSLDEIAQNLEEEIFIKNLESVQGDERDVILFSISYGPDENGKMTMNFGPLNRKGGWRRLNVAASRARKEMKVYASFEPENLAIKGTTPDGILGIQQFLFFARDGSMRTHHQTNEDSGQVDELVTRIADLLETNGYQVKANIGFSNLKIDLAVVDPDRPDTYLCALMTDGEQYASMATMRDRNRLVPSVFRQMGWELYPLWSLDWHENFDREAGRLLAHLAALVSEEEEAVEEADEAELPVDASHTGVSKAVETDGLAAESPGGQTTYGSGSWSRSDASDLPLEKTNIPAQRAPVIDMLNYTDDTIDSSRVASTYTVDPILDEDLSSVEEQIDLEQVYEYYVPEQTFPSESLTENPARIRTTMEAIIDAEAPIHEEMLYRRVADVFSGARMGKNNRMALTRAANAAKRYAVKQSDGRRIFWSEALDPNAYRIYRVPATTEERRVFLHIPEIELINALDVQIGDNLLTFVNQTDDDLKREIARLFGYTRLTQNINEFISSAMVQLKARWEEYDE